MIHDYYITLHCDDNQMHCPHIFKSEVYGLRGLWTASGPPPGTSPAVPCLRRHQSWQSQDQGLVHFLMEPHEPHSAQMMILKHVNVINISIIVTSF